MMIMNNLCRVPHMQNSSLVQFFLRAREVWVLLGDVQTFLLKLRREINDAIDFMLTTTILLIF